jgi:subtilisin family serine protease
MPHRLVFNADPKAVFVRAHDAKAVRTLARLGVQSTVGQWRLVQLDSVALLEALGGLGKLEVRSAPAHRPMLDLTVEETHAAWVHKGVGVELRRTGAGVLVGVIDTGIDLTHPDFKRADGSSRVVAVWDQDAVAQNPPQPFNYGRFCDSQEINRGQCDIVDAVGHGTHVAGIAAGNRGLAFEADIALVRSDTFTRLADAVQFLVDYGAKRGQGVAINISVGGQYGAHDGRTPLEKYLDQLLGPGAAVVAAAGNDGAGRLHIGTDLQGDLQRAQLSGVPWGRAVEITIELWTDPRTGVDLSVELWDGNTLVSSTPLAAHGSEFLDGIVRYQGLPVMDVGFGVELNPDNGLACRTVVIDPSLRQSKEGNLTVALALSGTGRIDGWISQSDYRVGVVRFSGTPPAHWLAGDGQYSITVPASAASVVAVGSYTVRSQWIDEANEKASIGNIPLGTLSGFSSRGPTLAPEVTGPKPDLAAPGSMIISARAFGIPSGFNTVDSNHMLLQGTSMAAPHVTGALALMMEANPRLNPKQARKIFQDTAVGHAWHDTGWGFGLLETSAAVAMAEKTQTGCAAAHGGWLGVLLALWWRRRRRPA